MLPVVSSTKTTSMVAFSRMTGSVTGAVGSCWMGVVTALTLPICGKRATVAVVAAKSATAIIFCFIIFSW